MHKYSKTLLFLAIIPTAIFGQEDSIPKKNTFEIKPLVYLRSAAAESKGGKTMADFQAPGALSHYRMGNEANTYGEFGLSYHQEFKDLDHSLDIVMMMSGYSPFGDKKDYKLDNVAQFYAKFNDVVAGGDLWAGKRYYDRRDYHMIDFFWYNPGQDATFGFGIENLRSDKHKDKLSFAAFAFDNKNVGSLSPLAEEAERAENLRSYHIEAKWSDIPTNKDGSVMAFVRAAKRRANEAINFKEANGFAVGLAHTQTNLIKGKATNSFQINYKKGISVAQNQYIGTPVYETHGDAEHIRYNLDKNYALEASNSFFYEDEKNFAVNALAIYRFENRGMKPVHVMDGQEFELGQKIHWFSAGFRAMKFLTKNFNLALEYGADYVNNHTIEKEGVLHKITFSPQIQLNYGFYTRPVIRPFFTYATWSEDLKGTIGGGYAPFADKTNGYTYGVSFEVWL